MAKDKRTRDQKRKAKLAKERQQAGKSNSLAYMGDKYKTQKLMHTLMNTEIGIYESYVMTDRKLLDQTVRAALEALIKKMQAGTLPPLSDIAEVDYEVGQEEDLVIANIRRTGQGTSQLNGDHRKTNVSASLERFWVRLKRCDPPALVLRVTCTISLVF